MRLYFEWGIKQLHKHGEELCGDSVAVARHADSVTLALSDGLGSGVKASISSVLTTQIAMHLLENDLSLGEVVQTLSETLPVCQVRRLAYSTFAIAQFFRHGTVRIVGFDSPQPVLVRSRKLHPLCCRERTVEGKNIQEWALDVGAGDWVVFVSDGVLNAGIGGVYPLGWGWEQMARFLEQHTHPDQSAQDVADMVVQTVSELYAGAAGDDVSIAVIKVRQKQLATVFTGPPGEPDMDEQAVAAFIKRPGRLAVCGGTTAKIVARYVGQPLEVDLQTITPEVPPMAQIEGFDLVTEGILTLTRVRELLQAGVDREAVRFKVDGASALLRLLLGADEVHFLVGSAVNPAHQNPELPHQLEIRLSVVREIAQELRNRDRDVTVESI